MFYLLSFPVSVPRVPIDSFLLAGRCCLLPNMGKDEESHGRKERDFGCVHVPPF